MSTRGSDITNKLLQAAARCRTDIQTAEMMLIVEVEYYRFLTEETTFPSCFAYFPLSLKILPFWSTQLQNNLVVYIYFIQIPLWFSFWERTLALIFQYQLNILIVSIIHELSLNQCNS